MSSFLIDSAVRLSPEDAGGHGGRWDAFGEVSGLMQRWLHEIVNKGELCDLGMKVPFTEQRRGMPLAYGVLHADDPSCKGRAGGMAVLENVAQDSEKAKLVLATAYPFLIEGVEVDSTISKISLHPTRVEARLRMSTPEGAAIEPFDTQFWKHGPYYREGALYRFVVSGLAYRIRKVTDTVQSIQVRGEPEPELIDFSRMCMLMPNDGGVADDHDYRGEVRAVQPRVFTLYGMPVWRLDVTLVRRDTEFTLPIYVGEGAFVDGWLPRVGDYVEGLLWMQAYAVKRDEGEV